ncbi:hypothetical protein E4U55_008246 [Claviceps digitariae]|nr:hypothetical protein E4U55_008246 [Claviceps digitariae]
MAKNPALDSLYPPELRTLEPDMMTTTLISIAMSAHWLETRLFQLVHLPTRTAFRMFPPADVVPPSRTYPVLQVYILVLLCILALPYFVWRDRRPSPGILGQLLRSWLERAGRRVEFLVMFARMWLCAAWMNMAAAHFFANPCMGNLAMDSFRGILGALLIM